MRATLAALALLALLAPREGAADPPWTAHGGRVTVLPSGTAASALARRALSRALPERAWTDLARVTLPGAVGSSPLVLPDGRLVLALESPASLLFVDQDGTVRATARLSQRVSRSPSLGSDGRIFAVTEDRSVVIAAPDGTLRGLVPVAALPASPPVVRSDGTVVLVGTSLTMHGELVVLSPAGDPLYVRSLALPIIPEPVLAPDDTLFAVVPDGLLSLDRHGEVTVTSLARSPTSLSVSPDGSLAAAAGNEVLILSREGSVRASVDAGSTVRWVAPLPGGRVAALRMGPPSELWLVTQSGGVLARTPIPASAHPPLVAPDGGMLVVTREGELFALSPDGAERWRLALRTSVHLPPVALPGGGVALCTASRELILAR